MMISWLRHGEARSRRGECEAYMDVILEVCFTAIRVADWSGGCGAVISLTCWLLLVMGGG